MKSKAKNHTLRPKFRRGDRVLLTPCDEYEDRTPIPGRIVEGPYDNIFVMRKGHEVAYTVDFDGKMSIARAEELSLAPFTYRVLLSDPNGLALASFEIEYPRNSHLTTASEGIRAEAGCIAENIAEEIEKHGASNLRAAIDKAEGK